MRHGKAAYFIFSGLLIAIAPAPSDAAPQEPPTLDYFIGKWNCAHTVGTFSGTYKTAYTKVLGGRWLQQTYDFPAQRTAAGEEPAISAVALMGFDERRQAWVRFFANSLGQYLHGHGPRVEI